MNIVCASDNKFVQHCAVTLVSILKNNPFGVIIYLLTEGLTNKNELLLDELVSNNGGEIHFILVHAAALKDCPMPPAASLSHISIATYYRLLISKLLPDQIDKVIYFDCDIVVRHSLNDLWNYNITDFAVGAVYQIANWNIKAIRRLGYPISFGYFNAGVLLVNLKFWRDNQISEKLFEYLNLKNEAIVYHDQDALNGLLHAHCLKLPCKWNMQNGFFKKNIFTINDLYNDEIINDYHEYKDQLLIVKNDPSVIHFVSKPKPWDAGCTHPFKNEYYKYIKYTSWHDYKAPKMWKIVIKKPNSVYFICKEMVKRIIKGNPYNVPDIKIKD